MYSYFQIPDTEYKAMSVIKGDVRKRSVYDE